MGVRVKACNCCRRTLDASEFSAMTASADGLQHACRTCGNFRKMMDRLAVREGYDRSRMAACVREACAVQQWDDSRDRDTDGSNVWGRQIVDGRMLSKWDAAHMGLRV